MGRHVCAKFAFCLIYYHSHLEGGIVFSSVCLYVCLYVMNR